MTSSTTKLLLLLLIFCSIFSANAQKKALELPKEARSLGPSVNSGQPELAPIISPDGQSLYFVRRGHSKNMGSENKDDLWMVQRLQNGQWSQAINCGAPLNNSANNRIYSIDPAAQKLYLLDNYQRNDMSGLAYAQLEGRQWSRPVHIDLPGFSSTGKRISFCVNIYGNVMLQSGKLSDGKGENDLYVAFRNSTGEWSTPRSLGEVINTPEQEENPYLAYDNKTLYFSSRGHGGKGGADLFVSHRLDDSWTNWSTPVNLTSINTVADDRFLTLSAVGTEAIVCYPDSSGQWDLFEISLPEDARPTPVALLNGQIMEAHTAHPMQGELGYRALDEPENLEKVKANPDGSFTLVVPYGDNVGLHAEVEGYFSVSERMEMTDEDLKEADHTPDNALASLSLSSAYLQRDIEINQLGLQLKALDDELRALHSQYEAFRKRMTNELQKDAPLVNTQALTDPELETLRHRYATFLQAEQDTIPNLIPEKEFTQKGGSAIPEDMVEEYDELADMKRRFRNNYEQSKNANEAPEEEFMWEAPKGLADFQEEVKADLRRELQAEVVNGLIEETSKELANQYLYDEISRQQMQDEENRLKAQIQASFAQSVTAPIPVVPDEEQWQEDLRTDLRAALTEDVKKDLEQELGEDIRTALRSKAHFVAKSTEAKTLQEELDRKVLLQIREEEQLGSHNPDNWDSTPSEVSATTITPAYAELSKVILLMPVEPGQVIPLHNLFFNPNTATFKSSSYAELNRVVEFLRSHPGVKVEIGGHTNGLLNHSQATQLSTKRAKAVSDYLATYQVPKSQITYKGYGKTHPLASNNTLEGRKMNQRIEMRILEVE